MKAAVRGGPELLPGLLAVGVLIGWSVAEGGTLEADTYPGSLFLLGLLVMVAAVYRDTLASIRGWRLAALGSLGAFALWNLLSIAWADADGEAWRGANLALTYFTVFALFTIPRWSSTSAGIVLGTYSFSMAVVGLVDLLSAAGSADPTLSFIGSQFVGPIGYQNGSVALFAVAFWPALLLAARREVHWSIRSLMLATAGLLFLLCLLPQSRGWLIAFPITAVFFLAVVPGRTRAIVTMVPLAAVLALSAGSLLDVFSTAQGDGDLAAALDSARDAVLIAVAALLVLGAIIALADRRLRLPPRAAKAGSRGVAAAAAAAAIVAVIAVVGAIGSPIKWGEERWDEFRAGYPEEGFGDARFGENLGSDRYDFWRVSLDSFLDNPVTGVGSDNFAADYLRERRSDEEPRHPHSLPLRVASQTGVVGIMLFVAFLGSASLGVFRVRRRGKPFEQALAAACVTTFAYWLLHSAGDWLWSIPAVTGAAFAMLAIGGRLDHASQPGAPIQQASRQVKVIGLAVGSLCALLLAASYALPWVAARDVDRAAQSWLNDPDGAFDALERARSLNFFSARPDVIAGTIATRMDDKESARAAFERAVERDPGNWYALLELGAIDALQGRESAAAARLSQARRLNPREPLIDAVLRGLRQDRPVSLEQIETELLERVCRQVSRTEETRFCAS